MTNNNNKWQTTTNDKQQQMTNNNKWQTTSNDEQRQTSRDDKQQQQMTNNNKWQTTTNNSCKWSPGRAGLLQMIIRAEGPASPTPCYTPPTPLLQKYFPSPNIFSFSFSIPHLIKQKPKVQCPQFISWTCLARESGLVDCAMWGQNYKDSFH